MIEVEITIRETGKKPIVVAMQISDRELLLMKPVARNPFAQALATAAERGNDPKQHIIRVARLLAEQAADYRDDRDGRNGERRAEIIREQERKS